MALCGNLYCSPAPTPRWVKTDQRWKTCLKSAPREKKKERKSEDDVARSQTPRPTQATPPPLEYRAEQNRHASVHPTTPIPGHTVPMHARVSCVSAGRNTAVPPYNPRLGVRTAPAHLAHLAPPTPTTTRTTTQQLRRKKERRRRRRGGKSRTQSANCTMMSNAA